MKRKGLFRFKHAGDAPRGCWRPFGQRLMGTGDPLGKLKEYWTCWQCLESSGDILGKAKVKMVCLQMSSMQHVFYAMWQNASVLQKVKCHKTSNVTKCPTSHTWGTTYTGEFKPPPIYGPPFLRSKGFAKNQFVGRAQTLMSLCPLHSPFQTTGQPSTPHLFEVTSYT